MLPRDGRLTCLSIIYVSTASPRTSQLNHSVVTVFGCVQNKILRAMDNQLEH